MEEEIVYLDEEDESNKDIDFLEDKKSILLKNRARILRMPNNKERVELVQSYYGLLDYYSYSKPNELYGTFSIDDVSSKYHRHVFNDTVKDLTNVSNNVELLIDKYKKVIDIYNNNGFYTFEYLNCNTVSPEKMLDAIWYFFSSLGEDVLRIYYDMLAGGNILLTQDTSGDLAYRYGFSMDTSLIDNSSIVMLDCGKYLDYYTTLAHEIGHCYQFKLQKNQRNFSFFDPFSEVSSIMFEMLFLDYLKDNHVIKNNFNKKLSEHICFYNETSISKLICKMFKDKQFKVINPFSLSYIAKIPDEELKKEICDECAHFGLGIINKEVEIDQITYSLGTAIALYFKERLKNNFDVEWENYKNFICEAQYLPLNEIIEKYFDTDIIEDNVKRFIKSYHNR